MDEGFEGPAYYSDEGWNLYGPSSNSLTSPETADNGDAVDLTNLAADQGNTPPSIVSTPQSLRERWRVLLHEDEKETCKHRPFGLFPFQPLSRSTGPGAAGAGDAKNLVMATGSTTDPCTEDSSLAPNAFDNQNQLILPGGMLTKLAIPKTRPFPPQSYSPEPAKSEMTHLEDSQYSQYLLHEIQNELSEGDTLIFVDFPAPTGKAADHVDCFLFHWSSVLFRMDSQKLLGTGSSKFAEMLNPSYQFRTQRRRKLVNKLPEGIKFVLDLTPPSEGDDLVFQMTEVSLTPGIINWWTAYYKHGVDDYVVGGHDDICSCWKDEPQDFAANVDAASAREAVANIDSQSSQDSGKNSDPEMERAIESAIAQSLQDTMPQEARPQENSRILHEGDAAMLLVKKSSGEFTPEPLPTWRQIPDYCPIRHRVNILRLMCIIAGKRVLLDSAPRVWTLVAIAKILDCTSVVRDLVLQWLMSPCNTMFIEVLPEESLQLGVALKLADVTQYAFRILVNELAIEEAAAPDGIPKAAPVTVFGRKRHDPGDDLNNLVQHAARAMVDRVSRSVRKLTSPTIYDDLDDPQWARLQGLIKVLSTVPNDASCVYAIQKAKALTLALDGVWKTMVVGEGFNKLLDGDRMMSIDNHRATYVDIRHFHRFQLIYNQFNDVQKALCPFLYENLNQRWGEVRGTLTFFSTGHNLFSLSSSLHYALEAVLTRHPEFKRDPAWKAVLPPRAAPGLLYDRALSIFNPSDFESSIKNFLEPFCCEWIHDDFGIPMYMSGHLLLNLVQSEFKFLPLWAGGNDDGTGGVFIDILPPANYGPAGPGPAYHTGATIPSDTSSVAGSVSSELKQLRLDGNSTIGPGSVDVQDGISTVYNPNKVIADSVSMGSESFTDSEFEFAQAKYAVPADGQSIGHAVERHVLDETTEHSENDTSFNFEEEEDDDDMDEVMTEIGPDDSRSREATPDSEHIATGSTAEVDSQSGSPLSGLKSSAKAVSFASDDEDDRGDMVMV